jgi:hypothetical protein
MLFSGHKPFSGSHLARRFSEPSVEGVRERTGFTISEKPRNAGNRQVSVLQMAFREFELQLSQDTGQGESFP